MRNDTPTDTDFDAGPDRYDDPDQDTAPIRERLDGEPVTGWRAALAVWAERMGAWFGADPAPTPSSASPAFAKPTRDTVMKGRLTVRQKLARLAVIGLAATLALLIGLDGFGAARRALDAILYQPQPTVVFSTGDYTLQHLPPLAQHLPRIALAPASVAPGVAYACWMNPYTLSSTIHRGQISAFQTKDDGATWRRLNIPTLSALDCNIITDGAGGPGALLIALPGYTTGGLCETPLLSYTSDGGATWRAVPWPTPGVTAPCDVQFAVEGGAIYAWSSDPLLVSGSPVNNLPVNATGRMAVTHDGGATWSAADIGVNDANGLTVVGFQDGGRILATIPDVSGQPGSATLMESTDYGSLWQSLGDPPGAFPMVYISTDPRLRHGWGRLYVLARPIVNGVPANSLTLFLETAASVGSDWTQIPLPPLARDATAATNATLPIVLGVGPAQSLLVERGAVATNDASQLSPAYWLWAWSAGQRRWLLDPQPTPGNADVYGWGWNNGDQTWWTTSLKLGVPPTLLLFTKTFQARALT